MPISITSTSRTATPGSCSIRHHRASDEIFFECFSLDESSYGWLSCEPRRVREPRRDGVRHDQHRLLATPSTTNSRRSVAIATPRSPSIPPGSRCRPATTSTSARRRSTCRTAGCAASCRCRSAMTMPAHVFDLHPVDMANILPASRRGRKRPARARCVSCSSRTRPWRWSSSRGTTG